MYDERFRWSVFKLQARITTIIARCWRFLRDCVFSVILIKKEKLLFLYSNNVSFREFYLLITTQHSRFRQRNVLSSQRLSSFKTFEYKHAQTMSYARAAFVLISREIVFRRCMKNERLSFLECFNRLSHQNYKIKTMSHQRVEIFDTYILILL